MDSLKINNNMDASTTNFPQIYLPPPEDVPSTSSQPPPKPQPPSSAENRPLPPSSTEIPAPVQGASSSSAPSVPPARKPEHLMYKNRLQEFAQKSNVALPMYQTVNEGTPNASRFRSTVLVDGKSYTTQITFSNRKAAEQDVARLALESLPEIIKDEGSPLVFENTILSKSILNEYATKLNVERPTYSTVQLKGALPFFVSSLVFNGVKYTGDVSKNKKEAEQLAARHAILSILGDPGSGTLFEIIKSKSRVNAAVRPNISQIIDASDVSAIANAGHASVSLDHKDKEVEGIVTADNNETKIELPVPSKILSPYQVSDGPKHVPFLEAPMLPNVSLQPASEQPIGDGSGSKKRRKNKKANKKARLESPLPIAASPVNEIPPCSVAQLPPCSVAQ